MFISSAMQGINTNFKPEHGINTNFHLLLVLLGGGGGGVIRHVHTWLSDILSVYYTSFGNLGSCASHPLMCNYIG